MNKCFILIKNIKIIKDIKALENLDLSDVLFDCNNNLDEYIKKNKNEIIFFDVTSSEKSKHKAIYLDTKITEEVELILIKRKQK